MMQRLCDVCGKVICKAPFGGMAVAVREDCNSRNTMRIAIRSKNGGGTNYDDVCGECTDGIIACIERRKEKRNEPIRD